MVVLIRNLIRLVLPDRAYQIVRRFWWWMTDSKPDFSGRKDLEIYDVQENLKVDVYWQATVFGSGPAFALSVFDQEVLKFDCFGEDDGHYHISFGDRVNVEENRLYFKEKTREQQIERSFFELKKNMGYYFQRHCDRRIRTIQIDSIRLEDVLKPIKEKMTTDISKALDATV